MLSAVSGLALLRAHSRWGENKREVLYPPQPCRVVIPWLERGSQGQRARDVSCDPAVETSVVWILSTKTTVQFVR